MSNSVCMVELSSIARGIETCDEMVKAAGVKLLKAATICPGKYMVIVGGDTGSVEASLSAGRRVAGEYLVDELFIPNIDNQLMPAISATNQIPTDGSIGVLEYYSVASAIKAADKAAKTADVALIEVRTGFAIGGKGFVTISGSVSSVREAVEAAKLENDLLVESAVIPRPTKELYESLM